MAFDRIRRDKTEKLVILDSNAIMMLFEFSIDLENELTRLLGKYHIIIPKAVLEELKFLSEYGKGKKKNLAKSSLKLSKRYQIFNSKEKQADEAVISVAKKTNGIVLTNDKELRNKLKENSCSSIFLRSKKTLEIE